MVRAVFPVFAEHCNYLIVGDEIAPDTGRFHFQGYCSLKTKKRLTWLSAQLKFGHFEVKRGSHKQAADYCKKGGVYQEWGALPAEQHAAGADSEQDRWSGARSAAVAGDFESVPDQIFVMYYNSLCRIRQDYMPDVPDQTGTTGVWIYGVSGVGKSWRARREYPDHYLKPCNKWWDGYQGETNIIIDDFGKEHACLGHHLKIWADRYAYTAEVKGTSIKIRPEKVIVTSQYSIEDIWDDEETRSALRRRFRCIKMVNPFGHVAGMDLAEPQVPTSSNTGTVHTWNAPE